MKATALMAVAALGLAACGSSGTSSSTSSAASSNVSASVGGGGYGSGSSKSASKAAATSSSGSVAIGMYDNYFGPKAITGKPGSTVTVKLTNKGANQHNFKVIGQKADADVAPGQSATVSVVIPKSGSAQFYCEYHKGLGMVGTVKPA